MILTGNRDGWLITSSGAHSSWSSLPWCFLFWPHGLYCAASLLVAVYRMKGVTVLLRKLFTSICIRQALHLVPESKPANSPSCCTSYACLAWNIDGLIPTLKGEWISSP